MSLNFGPTISAASTWWDPWNHIQFHSPSQSSQGHSVVRFPPQGKLENSVHVPAPALEFHASVQSVWWVAKECSHHSHKIQLLHYQVRNRNASSKSNEVYWPGPPRIRTDTLLTFSTVYFPNTLPNSWPLRPTICPPSTCYEKPRQPRHQISCRLSQTHLKGKYFTFTVGFRSKGKCFQPLTN